MQIDPLDIAAQQEALEQTAAQHKYDAKVIDVDFKWQMKTRQGRRIIYRLLASAGVWRSSFDENALRMAFSEGRRHEGLELLAQLMRYTPEQYDTMIKEQLSNAA